MQLLQEHYTFEIAVGMNGRVWLDSTKVGDTLDIVDLITESERIPIEQLKKQFSKKKHK